LKNLATIASLSFSLQHHLSHSLLQSKPLQEKHPGQMLNTITSAFAPNPPQNGKGITAAVCGRGKSKGERPREY